MKFLKYAQLVPIQGENACKTMPPVTNGFLVCGYQGEDDDGFALCQVRCHDGYASLKDVIVCTADGWETSTPNCYKTHTIPRNNNLNAAMRDDGDDEACPCARTPAVPENGNLICGYDQPDKDVFHLCEVRCHGGYLPQEPQSFRCSAEYGWEDVPTCASGSAYGQQPLYVPHPCEKLPPMTEKNGNLVCGIEDDSDLITVCELHCHSGYSTERKQFRCNDNGWQPMPVCGSNQRDAGDIRCEEFPSFVTEPENKISGRSQFSVHDLRSGPAGLFYSCEGSTSRYYVRCNNGIAPGNNSENFPCDDNDADAPVFDRDDTGRAHRLLQGFMEHGHGFLRQHHGRMHHDSHDLHRGHDRHGVRGWHHGVNGADYDEFHRPRGQRRNRQRNNNTTLLQSRNRSNRVRSRATPAPRTQRPREMPTLRVPEPTNREMPTLRVPEPTNREMPTLLSKKPTTSNNNTLMKSNRDFGGETCGSHRVQCHTGGGVPKANFENTPCGLHHTGLCEFDECCVRTNRRLQGFMDGGHARLRQHFGKTHHESHDLHAGRPREGVTGYHHGVNGSDYDRWFKSNGNYPQDHDHRLSHDRNQRRQRPARRERPARRNRNRNQGQRRPVQPEQEQPVNPEVPTLLQSRPPVQNEPQNVNTQPKTNMRKIQGNQTCKQVSCESAGASRIPGTENAPCGAHETGLCAFEECCTH